MNREITLSVQDVSIAYKVVKGFSIKRNLLKNDKVRMKEYEAIKNVSFEAEKGEILGVIGQNGSGKSTLLRAIASIYNPNRGSIRLYGHSVSLMALGIGFQRELTGRDNIMLSGMLLGFTKEMIREKMAEIIDFAELGEFIDMPVRTYSSGMHSKLAFAVTACLETDIMLVDEVLSVGDARFKKKSMQRMRELIMQRDRTVLIVSHNLGTISELCHKVLWLHEGRMKMFGETGEVLQAYEEMYGGGNS